MHVPTISSTFSELKVDKEKPEKPMITMSPKDGIYGTGIDILIKLLENRLTKIIKQIPISGAIWNLLQFM